MAELISVIVTTYNREDALDAVLRSLVRQTDRDFEVVVADDGSAAATGRLIESLEARDSAVASSTSGTKTAASAPPRSATAPSWPRAAPTASSSTATASCGRISSPPIGGWPSRGAFVTGNRILLSQALTEKVLRDGLAPEGWRLVDWIGERLRGGINRLSALMRLPLGPLRRLRGRAWQGARSCNLAVWRADLDRVDGFDADYSGWGKEDSDIIARLLHAGVRRKDGVFATGVLHLWHAEADRSQLAENERKLAGIIESRGVRARRGLTALRAEAAAAQRAG